jgi:formamidopyrimidine-DNA glycosylase
MAEAEEIRHAADAKLAELVAAIKQQEATEPGASRPGPEVRRLTGELRAINAKLESYRQANARCRGCHGG